MQANNKLAHNLAAARSRMFVGREEEKRQFEALFEANSDVRLLYVSGPGGIGKSTLLRECRETAEARGLSCQILDARDLPGAPWAIKEFVTRQLPQVSHGPYILFFDTFELLAPLERWFLQTLLPNLPGELRVVIAGRQKLSAESVADLGWSEFLRELPLRRFSDSESSEFLKRKQLPDALHAKAIAMACGNPLALSMSLDVLQSDPNARIVGKGEQELLTRLTIHFLRGVNDPVQRLALQAAAIVRHVDEPMLAALLNSDKVAEVYAWLSAQSCMEMKKQGLKPHDLVRAALVEQLRHQDSDIYETLVARAWEETIRRIAADRRQLDEQAVLNMYFIMRDTPLVNSIYKVEEAGDCYCDVAAAEDWPQVCSMVERFEGLGSRKSLEYWYARQPEGLVAVRNHENQLVGFVYGLELTGITREEAEQDPIVSRFYDFLHAQAPLAAGQKALLFTHWMSAEKYQALCSVQTQVAAYFVFQTLTTDKLAYVFSIQPDHPAWNKVAKLRDFRPLPGDKVEIAGKNCVLTYQDFTERTPLQWIRSLYAPMRGLKAAASATELQEPEFHQAVKEALKHFTRSDRLHDNPLLHIHLVTRATENEDSMQRIDALRGIIRECWKKLSATPKNAVYARVLEHTYLNPAANQAIAADELNLSERTYRRRLTEATRLLAGELWIAERASV